MTGDDNLDTTLTQLGAADGPPADPAFADRLDAALRTAHSAQVGERNQRSVWVPVTAAVSALAAVVVGASIWLVAFAGDPAAEVVMTAAVDTEVVLPGETVSAGEAGLSLPDGTRIVVGPEGEAVVDGVVLGPGAEAIVNDGRLDVTGPARAAPIDPSADQPEAGDPTSGTAAGPRSTTVPEADDGSGGGTSSSIRPSTSTSDERPTTSTPTTATTQRPRPTDDSRVSTTQTSSTQPTTTTATTPTTTITTDPAPLSIELAATSVPRSRIRLDWMVEGGPAPAGFRVEATVGDRTSTIVSIRSSGARSTTIERMPSGVSYRVVAVAEDGATLQTSNSVPQPAP